MGRKSRKKRAPSPSQAASPLAPAASTATAPTDGNGVDRAPQIQLEEYIARQHRRARRAYAGGDYKRAALAITKAILRLGATNPFRLAELLLDRAICRLCDKEYAKSLEDAFIATRLNPNFIKAMLCRVVALVHLNKNGEALEALESAAKHVMAADTVYLPLIQQIREAIAALRKKGEHSKKKIKEATEPPGGWWLGESTLLTLSEPRDAGGTTSKTTPKEPRQQPKSARARKKAPTPAEPSKPSKAPPETKHNTKEKSKGKKRVTPPPKQPAPPSRTTAAPAVPKTSPAFLVREPTAPPDLPLLIPIGEMTSPSELGSLTPEEAAAQEKELGNRAYKAEDFVQALLHYTKAIKLNSSDPIFFSNRAAAYLKLGRFYEAITDCTASLERKPSVKAYARRANAWAEVGEYQHAVQDYKHALCCEPGNRECLSEFEKVLMRLEEDAKQRNAANARDERAQADLKLVRDELKFVREELKRLGLPPKQRTPASPKESGGKSPTPTVDPVDAAKRAAAQVVHCTQLIQSDPINTNAYIGRAQAYMQLNEVDKAIADLRKALKGDPDNREVQQLLKAVLSQNKKAKI